MTHILSDFNIHTDDPSNTMASLFLIFPPISLSCNLLQLSCPMDITLDLVITTNYNASMGFPGVAVVKNLPAKQEIRVRVLGQEYPLEKKMTTHSSIIAWKIPWIEEPGELQSRGSQKSQTQLGN